MWKKYRKVQAFGREWDLYAENEVRKNGESA